MGLPSHLSQTHALGAQINQCIAQYEIGSMKNFVYLILDWSTQKAAIIDPQRNLQEPLDFIKTHQFTLDFVLLTHTHFDHCAGVPELRSTFTDLPIYVHPDDAHRLKYPTTALRDGESLALGSLSIQIFHTPGHSAGECCFLIQTSTHAYLLTGDTLFIRDCGRTDLETGSNSDLYESLQKIKNLSPETIILPGHHYQPECASTLAYELRDNPALLCKSVQELAQLP